MTGLFFTSQGCPPCKKMLPVIKKLQSEGFNIEIIATSDNQRVEKYRIQATPTLIILNTSGTEIKRWEGIVAESEILAVFKKSHNYDIW